MLSSSDVQLTDIRTTLLQRHMKASYTALPGGRQRLIVNGVVVVERDDRGDLKVEGPLVEDFFEVREVIYGQYVML